MLDFSQIATQIGTFSSENANVRKRLETALKEASTRMRGASDGWEAIQTRIADSKTSWLVAKWREAPDTVAALPCHAEAYTVIAADGSQIVSDRHDIALCYLLNVGVIVLQYGELAHAELFSQAALAPPEDDPEEAAQGELTAIAGKRLGIRRQMAEFAALAERIEAQELGMPTLALFDGSLILWSLETEQDAFRSEILEALRGHLKTARDRAVPIVGYISRPASRDVVNSLRVAVCPHLKANCDTYCTNRARPKPYFIAPDCAGTEGVRDADLFAELLCEGERSAVFESDSQILAEYQEHSVCFFYLHVGDEIARCEIPRWVADDAAMLDSVHALCINQARKGFGYPVALAEAHEQAIVRNAEKDAFFHLLERSFIRSGQPSARTQKAVSKRARRI